MKDIEWSFSFYLESRRRDRQTVPHLSSVESIVLETNQPIFKYSHQPPPYLRFYRVSRPSGVRGEIPPGLRIRLMASAG